MKVFMINTVCGTGSTGRICTALADSVTALDHEAKIAYRGSYAPPEEYQKYGVPVGSNAGVYCHALFSRLTDRAGFFSKRATRKLVDYIRQYQPDVIHLHNLHGYYINLEILFDYLKTEFKGRVVWTLHDCWAFTGHCTYYTCAGCDKWKTGCHHCPEKGRYPASRLLDSSQKNYKDKKRILTGVPNLTVVTVSQWLKQQVEQSFLGGYPVKCVYNGIDYSIFRPLQSDVRTRLGLENKKMILAVSDGWGVRKGLHRLLSAAASAPEDWHFVIVGMNREQIESLPRNCTGMERTWNQEELVKLYTAADVFYNPSMEETFGLVTAEAIACGTPAVVMNSTACPEPLCGYGVALDSLEPEAAISAIEQQMGRKQSLPELHFAKEKMIDQYISLYTTERNK